MINNKIFDYIQKVNWIAHKYGELKQSAYNERQYSKCREYKLVQYRLYLLKSLLLLDMLKEGAAKTAAPCLDRFGNLVETIKSDGGEYVFHSPSCNSPADGEQYEVLRKRTCVYNNLYWRPYEYYLKKVLSSDNKELYDILTEYNFEVGLGDRDRVLELLDSNNITGKIHQSLTPSWCTFELFFCTIYKDNFKICDFKVIINEFEGDLILTDNDGRLAVIDYEDSYDFLDDFSNDYWMSGYEDNV